MRYGICTLSIIPCRKKPSDKSEMVTQLLFGEHYELLEIRDNWSLVRIAHDGYECWIDSKQVTEITQNEYVELNGLPGRCAIDHISEAVRIKDNTKTAILMGSSLPHFDSGKTRLGDEEYKLEGKAILTETIILKPVNIINNALKYLNVPYLWGGRSPFGIDCSGLIQMVFKLCGMDLPRDASQQAEKGTTINLFDESQEGDLAFCENEKGVITHVGIIMKDNRIIHASGKVRVDKIDHQGIYNIEIKEYSHKLRLVKRIPVKKS